MQQTTEDQRLRALAAFRLVDDAGSALAGAVARNDLDTSTAADIAAVTRLATTVTGLPLASLNIFDATRQVQLAAIGAPAGTSPREESPCASHFLDGELVHVADASTDPRFALNPYVDGRFGALRAYASAPLVTSDGYALGTLCVADLEPRDLAPQQLIALHDLSRVVLSLFERRRQARISAGLALEAEEQRQLTELLMIEASHRSQLVEAVFAGVGVGIVVAGADGALQATNATADVWLGRPTALGLPLTEHPRVYDLRASDGTTPMATDELPIRRALVEGPVDGVEMVIVDPQGRSRAVVCSARPLVDDRGLVTGAVAALHDVSALRARERALEDAHAQLRRHADQAASVARAVQAVAVAEDPRAAICDAVRELTGADASLLMQPRGGQLVVTAGSGIGEDVASATSVTAPAVVPLSGGSQPVPGRGSLTAEAFASGEFIFVPSVDDDPRHDTALTAGSGIISGAWQPVTVEGRSTGVLVACWQHRVEEVSAAVRAMLDTLASAAAHAMQRAASREELAAAADLDPLTGLANRRSWDRAALREVARAGRSGAPLTFLLIDLDHFKRYNDSRGHLAGDDLLRAFGSRAADCLREVDVIARWGGEEFAVALPGCGADDAVLIADRIRRCVPEGQTATIGVAQWLPGATVDQVLSAADAALYRGKQGGRNSTVVQEPARARPS